MNRFESAQHPVIYWLIALSVAAIFIIDMRTPIGVTTWIFYLLPLLMCFLVPKPWLPLIVAAASSALIVADWFLSPAGTSSEISRINRGMGLVCIWSTAALAHFTLATRLKLREQDWMRTARARLADALVGEQSLARMAQRVLEFLVNYLGAQAGTMYVAEPSGAYSRVAAIGVDAAAQLPTAVTAGDGLLGRAIVERKALRIENLPADYLKVGSGLGSRKPHALLIAPLVADETAHGVLELGFLHPSLRFGSRPAGRHGRAHRDCHPHRHAAP